MPFNNFLNKYYVKHFKRRGWLLILYPLFYLNWRYCSSSNFNTFISKLVATVSTVEMLDFIPNVFLDATF